MPSILGMGNIWLRPVSFDDGDFLFCYRFLREFAVHPKDIPFPSIKNFWSPHHPLQY